MRSESTRWVFVLSVALPLTSSLIFLLAFVGCDSDAMLTGPSADCVEAGVQCQLSKGPLGVCERAQCEAGGTPPCFQCISQH